MHFFIDQPHFFQAKLLHCYQNIKRNLPWRETKNPYNIWLSEIILQQTRVNQGLSYYLKFISHYPSVQDLAYASEEDILKDWQGLGYYSRARNLHTAAKYISNELNNEFPKDFHSIKALKGIGDYTAAAIASFAYNLPHPVVDGNVYRVLSRIFGISTAIDSSKGKKEFSELAHTLIDQKNPAEYNQAIMEFGALVCLPKNPTCENCTFNEKCIAYKSNIVTKFPVKENKIKQKKRYLNYLIFENENFIAVNKRTQKGIWQNLYDFPMLESSQNLSYKALQKHGDFSTLSNQVKYRFQAQSTSKKHILSHQILNATFFHFYSEDLNPLKELDFFLINKSKLAELPIPKLIENYLNEETNLLSLFET